MQRAFRYGSYPGKPVRSFNVELVRNPGCLNEGIEGRLYKFTTLVLQQNFPSFLINVEMSL
ncbi:hypothetical protein D7Y13_36660 [Corallococcus praedator]|uniref:Uncharacterized protein n=1 Tax=Corallococcus praedator TaxID=2316724 RepID=A0ABX9Q8C4_9BACT|nr:hypothetical protein D7X75_39440 [Corallococcus sp. CA031C]RKH92457.1 hypothetical protein D7Y13_36660 [Corallococcus praedator]